MNMQFLRLASSCIAGLLLLGAAGMSAAADYLTLNHRDGNHFVLSKQPAVRVGNAAIVRVLIHFPRSSSIAASHHLLACDGSWMTNNFAYLSMPGGPADFAELERRSSATMPEVIETELHFEMQTDEGSLDGPALKKHMRRLCAEARPAPASMLVPIGAARFAPDQLLVFSMAAKPVQVKGQRVRAWFRTTFYTQAPTVGRQPDPGVPTGEYWLTMKEVDCATPQFKELEKVVHTPSSTQRGACPAAQKSDCPMMPLKEYSMGDAERKMACRLFGKPGLKLPL